MIPLNKHLGVFSSLSKPDIDEIGNAIFRFLSGASANIPLQLEAMPLQEHVVETVTTESLLEYTRQDEEFAKTISDEITEMTCEAQADVKRADPHKAERELLQQFEQSTKDTYRQVQQPAFTFLEDAYKPHQIDTAFYQEQFEQTQGDNARLFYGSVKSHFTKQWGALLKKKQDEFEMDVLASARAKYLDGLRGRLQKMKQLEGLLADILGKMPGKLGKLYGLSKGNIRFKNFDILQQYEQMLKGDRSVQHMANILGRMAQPELGYEDEIFTNTLNKPEYKADFAAKSDIIGVRESDEIANMLSSEKVLIADVLLQPIFFKKFAEKKLQTYEYRGRFLSFREEEFQDKRQKVKESPKGPLILCIATSGSMAMYDGVPERVAKIITYAVVKIALAEDRKCYLINFSRGIETKELSDPRSALNNLIDFLYKSFDGGTDAAPALIEALRMLNTNDYKRADVLMVSDFQMGNLSTNIVEQINKARGNKTKFHSLVIPNSISDASNKTVITCFDNNWYYDSGSALDKLRRA